MQSRYFIIAIISYLLLFTSCSTEKKEKIEDQPLNVQVYSPQILSGEDIALSGTVSAKQTAIISTRYIGYVDKIHVKQGDKVKEGQLLVSIKSEDLRAKQIQAQAMVKEAKAALNSSNRDLERYQNLRYKNSVSDKELENVSLQNTSLQSRLQIAQQTLREVNSMIAYTQIRAPFSGVIAQKMIDEGSTASPGIPLLVIEQNDELNITANVPENYISQISKDDMVEINVKSLNRTFLGKVIELSPSAYLTSGQYSIKVKISTSDKHGLYPGMYASLLLKNHKVDNGSRKIFVDTSYIIYKEQLTGVYVVSEDNRAILRWIRLGKKNGNLIEVISGLQASDKIIKLGKEKLYNGQKVIITK